MVGRDSDQFSKGAKQLADIREKMVNFMMKQEEANRVRAEREMKMASRRDKLMVQALKILEGWGNS